jgi:hypothetical protein
MKEQQKRKGLEFDDKDEVVSQLTEFFIEKVTQAGAVGAWVNIDMGENTIQRFHHLEPTTLAGCIEAGFRQLPKKLQKILGLVLMLGD